VILEVETPGVKFLKCISFKTPALFDLEFQNSAEQQHLWTYIGDKPRLVARGVPINQKF